MLRNLSPEGETMSKKVAVLLFGWNPDVVDYSKWPGLTPQKLRAALEADRNKLQELGFDAELGLITSSESATETVKALLKEKNPECVLIGAGVRTVSEYVLLFEQLVNTVHEFAPAAKLCFNTGPTDSVQAVLRWFPTGAGTS
jgi:hypothetical protein